MSFEWIERLRHVFTFRLTAWFFGISAASSLLITILTYMVLAASLRERDYDAVRALAVRYAHTYARGGIRAVEQSVAADRLTGRYEPFFLRIARGPNAVLYLTLPADWGTLDGARVHWARTAAGGLLELPLGGAQAPLDVSGVRLPDGTEMQVGKSSAIRREALARFRAWAIVILGSVFAITWMGASLLTHSALAPLRALTSTIQRILKTGNIGTRVSVRHTSDPLDVAASLFNDLLARLERLIAGMRQTLDNTAHDLRTPLTRARSHAETVLRGPADLPVYAAALESTLEEIDRIDEMLTTLMDISEAETGAMRLTRSPVNVAALFEETRELYADAADARRLDLTLDAPTDLTLDADHNRLRRVLANLVDNAIKYTPDGGRIHLQGRRINGSIEIRVEDTGAGIPADELPRIWDRLFRGDRSRSERGLGLGLSLVKAIVDAHGGRVEATSTVGKGSTFVLRFPADGSASLAEM